MLPRVIPTALSASHSFYTPLYPPRIQSSLPRHTTTLLPQRNDQAFICEAARSSAPPASKAPPKQPAPNSLPYIARRARRQRRLQQREQGQEANPGAAGGAWGQHDAQEDAPSNSLLHSQQDQPSSAAPLPPGQAPGATKNGRTHRRASAEAASCKLTTDISRAHSLNELSGLLDKHGDSMNIVNITAFLSRLPRLLREKYTPAAQQATQPGSGGAAAAAAAASSADPPSFLLLPPEEAAALESSTSRVSPLTQVGIPSHGSNVHARSTQGLQSLTIQEPSRAIDSSLVQQQAQQLHIRGGSGVGSAANEGTGLLGDSVGYASRGELKGMEIEVGKSSGAGQGSAGTLINSGIQEGTVPWGRSSSSSSNSSNSSSRGSSKSSSARTVATPKLYQPLKHAQKLARRALLLLQPLILEVDGRGIANVLHALACLELHDTDIIDDLLYLSIEFLPTLNGQAFSNIIYALACLGVRPQRQWSIAFFRHSLPVLPSFSLQSLSNTMWALARLRLSPRARGFNKDWDGAMFAAVQARLSCPPSREDLVSPQALSNLAWAIGALDLRPPLGLRMALLAHSQRSMAAFSPQGMANMLWGLARSRTSVPSTWMAVFTEVTYPRLSTYNTMVLCTLLYSLALLRQPLKDKMPDPSTTITAGRAASARAKLVWGEKDSWDMAGVGEQGAQHASSLSLAAPATAPFIAPTLPPPSQPSQSPSQSSPSQSSQTPSQSSPTSSQSPPSPSQLSPSQSPPQQHQATPTPKSSSTATADASTATATASAATPSVTASSTASRCAQALDAWFMEAQRVLQLALPHCSPRTTASLWYSFGRLHRVPEPSLLQALLAHSKQQLPDMQPQGLANTTWALACLGITLSPSWVAVLLEAASPKMGDMNAQKLSNFVWGLAKLGHRPDGAWLQQMVQQSSLKLPEYNPQDLSSTAYALATFRYCPGLAWQHAFARRLHESLHSLRRIHKIRILQAVAQLSLPLPRLLLTEIGASATADVTQVYMDEATVVLMQAMVALRLPISPQWLEMFAGEAEAHAGETQPSQLADIAGAFVALSYQPMPSLLAVMDAQMLSQQQPLLQPHLMDTHQHKQQQQQQQQRQHPLYQDLEQQDPHHLGILGKQQQQQQQPQQQLQTQQPQEQQQQQQKVQQQLQHQPDEQLHQVRPWVSSQKSRLLQPPKKPAPLVHARVRPQTEGSLQQPLPFSGSLEQQQQQQQQQQKQSLQEQQRKQQLPLKLASLQHPSQPVTVDTVAQQAALHALCRYVSLRPSFSTPPSPAWLHSAQQHLCSPAAVQVLPAETFLFALGALARMGQPTHAALASVASRYAVPLPANKSSHGQEVQQQQQQRQWGTALS